MCVCVCVVVVVVVVVLKWNVVIVIFFVVIGAATWTYCIRVFKDTFTACSIYEGEAKVHRIFFVDVDVGWMHGVHVSVLFRFAHILPAQLANFHLQISPPWLTSWLSRDMWARAPSSNKHQRDDHMFVLQVHQAALSTTVAIPTKHIQTYKTHFVNFLQRSQDP